MARFITPNAKQRFFDDNGDPLSGGKLYTYEAGTTTPAVTYSSLAGAANANPIILDADGECDVWLDDGESYKFVLANSSDVVQWTVDNISIASVEADSVATKTTTYTATANDDVILVETASAWTLSLYPAAGNSGKSLTIKKTSNDTNALTIDPNGTETIDGFLNVKLNFKNDFIRLVCDGSNWYSSSSRRAPTVQRLTTGTAQTYTTPLGCMGIVVDILGGGGGGAAADTVGGNNGVGGNSSTFGTLTAGGGGGGQWNGQGGVGGSPTVGAGFTTIVSMNGNGGNVWSGGNSTNNIFSGANGGAGYFGGAPAAASYTNNGTAGTANSGSGGQGGGTNAVASSVPGSGGGSGAYIKAISTGAPLATYTYTVGTGGNGGAGGQKNGGAGGSGIIIVTEYYQ